jgi:orotate phosphoribosyltransferase
MIDQKEVARIFRETGVIMDGHFELTSGRHSNIYLQCAQVIQYPEYTSLFCQSFADYFGPNIDVVIGPALGGVILAYETARLLGCRSIFSEKEKGKMPLRRGFALREGERVLITEDVITTGGSIYKVIDIVESFNAAVVGVASLVDRSGGRVIFNVPTYSLIQLESESYLPEECPLCRLGIPSVKPGSSEPKTD